jgi:hypothetical protein
LTWTNIISNDDHFYILGVCDGKMDSLLYINRRPTFYPVIYRIQNTHITVILKNIGSIFSKQTEIIASMIYFKGQWEDNTQSTFSEVELIQ